jgi:hypothetical protein
MKTILFYCFLSTLSLCAIAQTKPTDLDKSPMDMSYFPANYPIAKMKGQMLQDPSIRIIYSRPQKNNREIFGGQLKFNEVWRLGANEATEIEFFRNAKMGNSKIPKGRYSMFCIPTENKWTLIINKDLYSWGSFTYNQAKDVARIDVPAQKNSEVVEIFTMYFEPAKSGAQLMVAWDDVKVAVPISF